MKAELVFGHHGKSGEWKTPQVFAHAIKFLKEEALQMIRM